ncbi:MAG: hypothetical protein ACJAZ2_001509 [Glaciecola sp.]|jgi:hypothetical protein
MKKAIILCAVLFLIGSISYAQTRKKTMAEIRKERMSKKKEKEIYAEEKNPAFMVTEGPLKWKNESAVVLAYEHTFKSNRKRIGETGPAIGGLVFEETIRKRVKLQDGRAVAMFSQIYFSQSNGDKYIHVIKPNGKEIWVDMRLAVNVVTNVPVYYQTSSKSSTIRYSKVAIPNLEIGDIVDYRYGAVVMFSSKTDGFDFPVIDFDLVDNFPIVYSKAIFDLDKQTYLTAKSLNGAPPIQELITDNGHRNFYLLHNDVEAADGERWDYPIVQHPMLRFQLIFTERKSKYGRKTSFLPKGKQSLRTTVNYNDITDRIDSYLKFERPTDKVTSYVGHVMRIMKRFNSSASDDEYINKAYYIIRQKAYHSKNSFGSKFYSVLSEYKRPDPPANDGISDNDFLHIWVMLAEKNDWNYSIGLAVPRYLGGVKSVLTLNDFEPYIIVNGQSIFNCTKSSVLNAVPSYLAGSETVVLGISGKSPAVNLASNDRKKNYTFKQERIQELNSEVNSYDQYFDLKLNLTDKTVAMNDSVVSKGKCKSYYSYSVFYGVDVWEDEHKLTGVGKRKTRKKTKKSSKTLEKERVQKGEEAADKKVKLEYIKEILESENLKVVSVEDFKLIQEGRSTATPERIFTINATLKDLIRKAGPNYLFNVGKIIGDQVIIEDHEKKRVNDIYLNYAKTFRYVLNFDVPAGYSLAGLSKLEQKVDNSIASLSIKTNKTENHVTISVEHKYKKKEFKKEQWPSMIQVLKAVEDFYDAKLMLKKG